ncbi:MAG TPA: ribokinase [Caulobacteraceae bacterium]|jgi:ribokinase
MTVCVLGSVILDNVLRVASLPRPGETAIAHATSRHLGGKGANQAVAAVRAGEAVTFIGATGRDDDSRWMRERLTDLGVDTTHLAMIDGVPAGEGYVTLSDDGENSIVIVAGANRALTARHLTEAAIAGHDVYLAQLEVPIEVVAALFSHPDAKAGVKILNAAPADPEGRRLFPLVDILVVNETELADFAGLAAGNVDTPDLVRGARTLIERPGQAVVVTLGAAGAIVVREASVTPIPGRRVNVVDTTGAGDCFCGVLAAEMARGQRLEDAAMVANAAAALAVTRLGASSVPSRAGFEAFLERPS